MDKGERACPGQRGEHWTTEWRYCENAAGELYTFTVINESRMLMAAHRTRFLSKLDPCENVLSCWHKFQGGKGGHSPNGYWQTVPQPKYDSFFQHHKCWHWYNYYYYYYYTLKWHYHRNAAGGLYIQQQYHISHVCSHSNSNNWHNHVRSLVIMTSNYLQR